MSLIIISVTKDGEPCLLLHPLIKHLEETAKFGFENSRLKGGSAYYEGVEKTADRLREAIEEQAAKAGIDA